MEKQQLENIFRNFLKRGKYRITPERFEILEAALNYNGHFGADDLFIELKNNKSAISRATVYNTLELLVQCDILLKRNFGDNITRYESCNTKAGHDHLICMECGKIIEFSNPRVKKLVKEVCEEMDFDFSNYSFNIFGKCKDGHTHNFQFEDSQSDSK